MLPVELSFMAETLALIFMWQTLFAAVWKMKSSKQYSNADKESLIGAAVWVDAKKCDRLHIFFHTDSCNHHFSDLAYKHCPAVIHICCQVSTMTMLRLQVCQADIYCCRRQKYHEKWIFLMTWKCRFCSVNIIFTYHRRIMW